MYMSTKLRITLKNLVENRSRGKIALGQLNHNFIDKDMYCTILY